MPHWTPNLLTRLRFCQWYKVLNAPPSSYKVNSTGIKWIATRLKVKAEDQKQGKWVRVPGIDEFLAELAVKLQLGRARVLVAVRAGRFVVGESGFSCKRFP